jgi:tetratricopeptide (TPR) repeat protein
MEAGDSLLAQHRYEEAVESYRKFLSSASTSGSTSEVHARLSFCLLKLHRTAEAVEHGLKATESTSSGPAKESEVAAWHSYAAALLEADKPAKAHVAAQKAIDVCDASGLSLKAEYLRNELQRLLRKTESALEEASEAPEGSPSLKITSAVTASSSAASAAAAAGSVAKSVTSAVLSPKVDSSVSLLHQPLSPCP